MNIATLFCASFIAWHTGAAAEHQLRMPSAPLKIHWLIQQLKKSNNQPIPFINNVCAICGPIGSGKTAIAHLIAQETGATIFTCQELSPIHLQALQLHIHEHLNEHNRRAIVLVDSIETMCAHAQMSAESAAQAIVTLRSWINQHAHSSQLFFILIAQERRTIEQLIDMPCDARAIILELPDEKKRLEFLIYFLDQAGKKIPSKIVAYAAKKSEGFHLHALRTLAHEIAIASELLCAKRMSKEIPIIIATVREQQCPTAPSNVFDRICSVSQKIIPVLASAVSAALAIISANKKG